MSQKPPPKSVLFWPVGNGDSTSIVIDDKTIVQIDIRQAAEAENDEDPHAPPPVSGTTSRTS